MQFYCVIERDNYSNYTQILNYRKTFTLTLYSSKLLIHCKKFRLSSVLIPTIYLQEKIEDAALLSLIRKLPFNIASLSQKLLEELEVFTRLGLDYPAEIRYAGILSFATLVHKTMESYHVKQDYFDNIVVKYFRMYSGSYYFCILFFIIVMVFNIV